MIIKRRARKAAPGGPDEPTLFGDDTAARQAAGDHDDRAILRAEQLLVLVRQAHSSAIANMVAALFVIVALWQPSKSYLTHYGAYTIPQAYVLAAWGAAICAVAWLCAQLLTPWQGRNADDLPPQEVRFALRRASIWIVAAGSLWGWAAVLVPQANIPAFATIVAGLAAVQVTLLMVQPLIAAAYILPVLVPLGVRLAAVGDRMSIIFGLLVFAYAVLLMIVARGGHVGFVTTIVARRRSERLATDLAAAQALLETTLENVDQGILMIDAERRVPVVNRRAIELLELPADLMTGRPPFEDVLRWQWTNGEFDNAPEPLRRFMASGGVATGRPVYEHHRPSGRVVEIRSIPLPGGGAVHTYSDVTEPRARETALRRAEAEYRSLYENAVVGVFRCAPDGRLLRANPALARLAGYRNEEALLAATRGRDVTRRWYVDPARRAEFVRRIREEGRVTDFICEVRTRVPGQSIWVSQNGWMVRGADGAPNYFEGTILDVTERHDAEDALARALAAEEASRIKSEFLANMSHELRTPLNAIIGFSEMLEQQAFGPLGDSRNGEYIGDILHSGRHLLGIVNDILDLAKIEAGHMELRFEEVDPIDIAQSCKRLVTAQAEAADVTLTLDIAPDAPLLHGDPKRIRQVLLNLLSNAVKFTPAGGTVALDMHSAPGRGPDRGDKVIISVTDTGIGMSPEEVKIALQPFRQVDSSRARRHEGTGLGLPLARRLVELHGGTFELESSPGRGTRAIMRFPALAAVETPPSTTLPRAAE